MKPLSTSKLISKSLSKPKNNKNTKKILNNKKNILSPFYTFNLNEITIKANNKESIEIKKLKKETQQKKLKIEHFPLKTKLKFLKNILKQLKVENYLIH